MTRKMLPKALVAAFCSVFLLQGLTACETTEGFGRDMQDAGDAIEEEAQD